MEVQLAPELAERVRLGVVHAEDLRTTREAPEVWAEAMGLQQALRGKYAGRPPGEIEALRHARELYRLLGEDPTKNRPSSEALLRRVLRGDGLPRINLLVDVVNLCSLEFLLPIGLYDLDRVRGEVCVRLGGPGEAYESLGKGTFRAEGRLVVADEEGPMGGPTNDSLRTAITEGTRRCLAVIFAPLSYPAHRMADHVRTLGERIARHGGGRVVQTHVLPPTAR
ncbi:MAG: phenylalanine--tRNA ligase beta subunit-related protein [Armatimonadota bacterium]|nr:phenylalanine--tRNA ligase beta subunit-related protein [Armatimonadota bacterium]MDR7444150.1 phenylalanine--tRNA ligase beta subunit-related protein [Armatimonadota bacterium]MDR7569567.1 phenylalanine--tRNA ligase beta subunit-related protein [Armatimonadota bacterium]MDR7613599.1 phenylalanine--tRNA ligase beta subunit-related protein [Armatimonadota bacterium]